MSLRAFLRTFSYVLSAMTEAVNTAFLSFRYHSTRELNPSLPTAKKTL